MPTPVHAPEDVSCRVVGGVLAHVRRAGRSTEPLTRGLNRTLSDLLDPAGMISWGEFLAFVRNCAAELTSEQAAELGAALGDSPYLRPLLLTAGRRANPARYYEWLADPRDGAAKHLFPCLDAHLTRIGARELLLTITPRTGRKRPPGQFWDVVGRALAALPVYFGLAAARVEREPSETGAAFRIGLPRRRPFRFAFTWLASWLRGDAPGDARAVLALAHERAKRHRAESALVHARRRFDQVADVVPGVVFQYVQTSGGTERFAFVSAGVRDLIGAKPAEVEADPQLLWGAVHPDDRSVIPASFTAAQKAGAPWAAEFRVTARDGAVKWVRGRAVPAPADGTGGVVWNGLLTDVTAEKRVEEQVRAQAARLEALTANAHVHIVELDRDGVIQYVTRTSAGRAPADVLGRRLTDFLAESDRGPIAAATANVLATGRAATALHFTAPDGHGTPRTYTATLSPVAVRPGAPVERVALAAFDVTDRKRAEDERRRIAEEYTNLFERAVIGVFRSTREGLYLAANAALARTFGYASAADLIAGVTDISTQLYADPRDRAEFLRRLSASGEVSGFECEGRRRDGAPIWVRLDARAVCGPDGAVCYLEGFLQDVTDRKRAEDALRQNEERLRQAARLTGFGVFDHDHRTGALYWSPRVCEIHDWPADREPDLEVAREQVHPDDRAALLAATARAHDPAGSGMFSCEYRIVRPDGRVRWVRGSAQTTFVGTGPGSRPDRTIGAVLDVTEAHEAEDALRASEERLRLALAAARMGTFDWDLRTGRGVWSGTHYELFGYPPGDHFPVRFNHFTDRLHPADRGHVEALMRAAQEARRPFTSETRVVLPDGSVRWVLGSGEFRYAADGTAVRMVGTALDITDRKRAEDALRESEERFRNMADHAPVMVWVTEADGRCTFLSQSWHEFTGQGAGAGHGFGWLDAVHPDDRGAVERAFVAANATGARFAADYRLRDRGGAYRWVLDSAAPRRSAGGEFLGYIGSVLDITDRKRAEDALRESERRLALAISATSDAVWERNYRTGESYYSPRWYEMLGRAPVPMTREQWEELCHPDDFAPALAGIRAALHAPESSGYAVEFRMRHADGSWVWVLSRGAVVERDPNGAPLRLSGTNTDVTARKRAEAERDESLARLRLHIERLPLAYVLYDAELRYADWNPAAEAIFGYTRDEILGRPLMDLVPPDAHAQVAAVRDRLLAGDLAARSINRNVTRSGAVILCEWYNTPLRRPDGTFLGILSMAQDVTEQVRTQEALRLKEQSLRLALDAGRMGTWEWELEPPRLTWDEREQALFGFAPGEFDGRLETFLYRVHPDDRAGVQQALAGARAGADVDIEFRICRPDGGERWVRGTGAPVPAGGDRPARLAGVSYDITARKRADERTLASLREKEAMLKEIHHRVKNNLQVVSSLLHLQAARVTHPAAAAVLAESQNRVRAMALVHEALYRSDDLARVNPGRYFGELCSYLFRVYGVDAARVRLELDIGPDPLPLDKTVPCGLIVNEVVSNALKYAFPDGRGGTVRVALRTAGGRFALALSDDGVGLPPDFAIDRAPSLGLRLVGILTEQLGGHLSVERSGGTAFLISFA
ncbi:PAS domain-containing protein [Gemmata sp. JC673]|uniref:histidine kinase n=1 Tax=Gemmata algarum TaxID=2975278 RepID=A0ABU5F049_9BACT|nr:PAS domain-containing protein [Gemmata algarum]MDY3560720.1 PAS domain-containing protein [Gemmata algarum]